MGLVDAASSGDQLKALQELRDLLALQIETSNSGRDVAALSRQLTDVLTRIEALAPTDKVDVVDEISARRNGRRSASAARPARSKRSS